ncbi:MAG: cellulose biosynthesis cyclic di-GMP-binding regulatory protein BcsB [Rubrivivax sp.]
MNGRRRRCARARPPTARAPQDRGHGFSRGAPIWLRYRYSPPIERNSSTLDISVNDRYLQTFRPAAQRRDRRH